MKEFSVQHYTFRPLANEIGLFPMLGKLREMGYTGVELCYFGGFEPLSMKPEELGSRMRDLGMKLVGNHFTRSMFQGEYEQAFEFIARAGGKYAVYNLWKEYKSADDVAEAAEFLNPLGELANQFGITLVYHNHAVEFEMIDNRLIIDWLAEHLNDNISFETDVFFARQHITDVCAYIRKNADRIKLVHLKQRNAQGENVDLPDGMISMPDVCDSARFATDFILEQSSFPDSIMDSLRRNAEYLKQL